MTFDLSWGDWAKLVVPIISTQLYMHFQNRERVKKKEIIDEQVSVEYPPHAHNSHEGIRYPVGQDPRYRWRDGD
jgi:hypothetical protein